MSFNFDVLGKLIIELRENGDVATLVEDRVRGFEPAPGDATRPFKRFLVLTTLDSPRYRSVPVQRPRVSVRCYGLTPQDAALVYTACSNALHHVGPRVHGNDLGIYNSHDDTGGTPGKDPQTGQPYVSFVVDLFATTQAVAT